MASQKTCLNKQPYSSIVFKQCYNVISTINLLYIRTYVHSQFIKNIMYIHTYVVTVHL